MKIRFYLRGLGLGILVTSIFFLICGRSSQTMSDEMIKARAKELGMTESMVLAELATQEAEEVSKTEETVQEVIEAEDITGETVTETVAETNETDNTEEMASEENEEEDVLTSEEASVEEVSEEEVVLAESSAGNTEPVSIMVNRGDGSDTVSKRLQEAGLVADAYEYDKYLMANGYDKRIGAGEHIIPAGATWEEIAKVLCNMK